jgi:hypothetical protein
MILISSAPRARVINQASFWGYFKVLETVSKAIPWPPLSIDMGPGDLKRLWNLWECGEPFEPNRTGLIDGFKVSAGMPLEPFREKINPVTQTRIAESLL